MKNNLLFLLFAFVSAMAVESEPTGYTKLKYSESDLKEEICVQTFHNTVTTYATANLMTGTLNQFSLSLNTEYINFGLGNFRREGLSTLVGRDYGSYSTISRKDSIIPPQYTSGTQFTGGWISSEYLTALISIDSSNNLIWKPRQNPVSSIELHYIRRTEIATCILGAKGKKADYYSFMVIPFGCVSLNLGGFSLWVLCSPVMSNFTHTRWDVAAACGFTGSYLMLELFLRVKEKGCRNIDLSVSKVPAIFKGTLHVFPKWKTSVYLSEYLRYKRYLTVLSEEIFVRNRTTGGIVFRHDLQNVTIITRNELPYTCNTEENTETLDFRTSNTIKLYEGFSFAAEYQQNIYSNSTHTTERSTCALGFDINQKNGNSQISQKAAVRYTFLHAEKSLFCAFKTAATTRMDNKIEFALSVKLNSHKCQFNIEGALFW